ncbi:MAG: ATP-binding protein [Planctomycetaceae bacterium]|nr:ATP-binding protein [Planctomycetaceae bacterium]
MSETNGAVRRFKLVLDNDKSKVSEVVDGLLEECVKQKILIDGDDFKVRVALEEALLNAIIHGNLEVSSTLREQGDDSYEQAISERQQSPAFRDRKVTIDCEFCSEKATFQIQDQGKGFDVSDIPDPTDPDYLDRPCGRGLLLMRAFMDEVVYNDRGNCVTLVKKADTPNDEPSGS